MIAVVLAMLLAVAPSAPAAAQEPPPGEPSTLGDAGAPAAGAAGLVAGTLAKDIDTASFYELTAWCRSLGLVESGSRRELQERLRKHYGLPAAGEPAAPGRTVTVRSARSAEYFTVEQADERYLVLSGDVVVELRDAEAGATHTVRAGRLTFNQARGILAAGGGVEYTLEEGGRTETFTGRSLSLDLDTWEAVFTDGRSSKTQSRGDRELTFTFEGESITRLAGDQVVLDEGTFTSCDLEDPHYAVRARKVWILAAGEWAMRNAVLTVGRVPVLWMPFFFYPGDKLVFNPAFGYRLREGAFVQTTTYLVGRRKEEESMFSFLKLTEAQGTAYDQELRGIFLRKLPARAPAEKAGDSTLKLLVDGYSRLGAFIGLAGEFPPTASFMGGVGFSRSIYEDPSTGFYTPYYPYVTGTETDWNESVLLGIPVPFRFGFKGDAKGSSAVWSGSLHFELFSDPDFSEDFYGRSEGFRLNEALTSVEGVSAAATNNLTWEITNRFDFSKLVSVPGITTLSVPYLNGRFSWLSREQDYVDNSKMEWDPGRTFYYPSSVAAPSASFTVSGELLRLGGAAKPKPAKVDAGSGGKPPGFGKGFRDPFAAGRASPAAPAAAAKASRLDLRSPRPRPDANLAATPAGPSLAVTYQATPRAALEHTFDAEDWNAPKDIDMGILYGTFETAGTGRVQAAGSLLGERLDLSVSLGFDSLWRLRFNPSSTLTADEWKALLLRDVQQDRLDFTSALGATLHPFGAVSAFAGSSVAWRLGMRLVQLRWDGDVLTILDPRFETRTLDLTANTVSEHSMKATVPFHTPGATGSFTLDAVLPPLDGTLTARLDASAWILKGRVQAGGTRSAGTWAAETLLFGLTAEPWKGVSLSEELQADLAAPRLSRSTTRLLADGFSASFVAEWRRKVNISTGVEYGSEMFLPSTVQVAYEDAVGPLWSWKDRVRIEAGLRTGWSMNVQRFTDNLFEFAPRLTLSVHEVLDLTFSSLSVNSKTYRYLPGLPEQLGESWVNPFVDLVKSFNFFYPADRYDSAFKIRAISLKAVHHLHDWDLSVEYSGAPQLVTSPVKQYVWSPSFTIQLQWVPVSELKAAASADRDGVYLRQ